jgi:hypothetical protein
MTGKMPVLLSVATADEITRLCRLQWPLHEYVTELAKQSTNAFAIVLQARVQLFAGLHRPRIV